MDVPLLKTGAAKKKRRQQRPAQNLVSNENNLKLRLSAKSKTD